MGDDEASRLVVPWSVVHRAQLVIIGSHCKWSKWISGCYTELISCSDLISHPDMLWSDMHLHPTLIPTDPSPEIFLLRKLNALDAGDPIPLPLPLLICSITFNRVLIKLHKSSLDLKTLCNPDSPPPPPMECHPPTVSPFLLRRKKILPPKEVGGQKEVGGKNPKLNQKRKLRCRSAVLLSNKRKQVKIAPERRKIQWKCAGHQRKE